MKAERIVQRIEALRRQQQQIEARERVRARKQRTHAAIVAGSLLLTRPDVFGLSLDATMVALARVVTRDHDRHALGLPIRDSAPPEPTPISS